MLQLLLFAGLLLLPFNSTPAFIVWGYQKLLLLSESGFLLIEAVMGVVTIMFISQSLVNEIDEHPAVVKVFLTIILLSSIEQITVTIINSYSSRTRRI